MSINLPPSDSLSPVIRPDQISQSLDQPKRQKPKTADKTSMPLDQLQLSTLPSTSAPIGYLQNMAQVEQIVQKLVQTAFPELSHERLVLKSLSSEDVFFQSNFKPLSLLTKKPTYVIQVNPGLFARQLPLEAARAILAHELSHTLDYQRQGLSGLARVGWQVMFHNQHYEHRTDIQAISRGFGEGLIAYREWIYGQIPPTDLAKKQSTYYQPAQIRQLMQRWEQAQAEGNTTNILTAWLKNPPFL